MVGLAVHVVGHAQGVDDGFLGAFHNGLVEAIARVVKQDLDSVGHARGGARNFVGRGETDDDLTRRVGGERAHATDAEGDAFAQARDLGRHKGRKQRTPMNALMTLLLLCVTSPARAKTTEFRRTCHCRSQQLLL